MCSISSKWGLSTPLIEEAHIYKAVLESGKNVYIMADSSKFETKSIAKIGPIKPEYTIITDRGLNEEILKEFNNYIRNGLKIIKA